MVNYSTILLFGSIPAAALLMGGLVSMVKRPGAKLRSAFLHFAAGVIFSVVAVELMPDIMDRHAPLEIGLGFGAGVLLMLAIRYFLASGKDNPKNGGYPAAFMMVIGIDLLIDGILMGLGFVTSRETGISLAIGLSVEFFSVGIATATTLMASRVSQIKIWASILALAALVLGSAFLSATALAGISKALMEIILSFGLAALLFLVTEELLAEAHESKQGPWLTAAFFAGFLLFMLLPVG